jgi:hypothetical protein
MTATSFWPNEILQTSAKPPAVILREQAENLTEMTTGALVGEVTTIGVGSGRIGHSPAIVVPALNDYRYTLVTVYHGPELYPVNLKCLPTDPDARPLGTAANEAEYGALLRDALNSSEVKKVLAGLYAQATM